MPYSIEPRTRKYAKGYGFLFFERKYIKKFLDTGLDALKTTSRKVVLKATKAIGEFIENKTADKVVKQKPVIYENSRNVE